MFELPDYVLYVLKKLSSRGFEAYIVGGCVRDIMLQKIPSDFDITTNALPFEIKECFEEHKIIDIGEKHGTVTIIIDSRKIEITTYRIDGTYSNNRHPDKVTFSCNLYDDLKRRDFTINIVTLLKFLYRKLKNHMDLNNIVHIINMTYGNILFMR